MLKNLCKEILSVGGTITPLIIPSNETNGTGLMNPSIFIDDDKLIMNLRHVNYTLYHCEGEQLFNSRYGPLTYLNPENDIHLRTWNYFCTLNNDLSIKEHFKVDTSKLDKEPVWEFVGLEDARLVKWDNKLYMCGVRRDTKTNGEGRIELSEIVFDKDIVKEIARYRIQPPNDPNSYCEKNWMPIIDMPYHFIKWTNPTEIVVVNPIIETSKTVFLSKKIIPNMGDFRGSSQVIPWENYRICIIHEDILFFNRQEQKDGKYFHRFIVWDKDWNIVHISNQFSFMTGEIEFCCGMALYKEDLLITFGFQDNLAFILKVPKKEIKELIDFKNEKNFLAEQNITNKLFGLPTIYYNSIEESENRRINLENQFKKYNIVKFIPNIYKRYYEGMHNILGINVPELNNHCKGGITSHLQTIKKWYNETLEDYGFFCEDDFCFDIIGKWNFTWQDFICKLPENWECVQLMIVKYMPLELKLRIRNPFDFSSGAYIMKRNYVEKLLNTYYPNKDFILNTAYIPVTENMLFLNLGKTYNFPLFSEEYEKLKTTYIEQKDTTLENEMHTKSYIEIKNLWEEKGKNLNLDECLKIEELSLEITPIIPEGGCIVNCLFCPQKTLINNYFGERKLSLINFKKIIDKIPGDVDIVFAGFGEPYMHKDCTEMIYYAYHHFHKVALFTTGIGMTIDDYDKIKTIPFVRGENRGFYLHVPDNEGYAKHIITKQYLELLKHISLDPPSSFYIMCMGTMHDSIKDLFTERYNFNLWNRAGNLDKEEIYKPELKNLRNIKYFTTVKRDKLTTCNQAENVRHNILLPNGDVVLCCQDWGLEHKLGNLLTQNYEDIIPAINTPFELCKSCENGKIL